MRSSTLIIAGLVGLATTVFASPSAEEIFDSKCAACHIKTMPTDRANMVAPALMGVMRHVKMAYPNKDEAVKFMVDYVQNPSKDKAICMPQKIARFGLMPSQKESISQKELQKVSEWMFDNYPPRNFSGMMNRPNFAMFDANGDGVVTKKELTDFRAKRQSQRAAQGMPMRNAANAPAFESMDADGNGELTQEELNTFRMNRFNTK